MKENLPSESKAICQVRDSFDGQVWWQTEFTVDQAPPSALRGFLFLFRRTWFQEQDSLMLEACRLVYTDI